MLSLIHSINKTIQLTKSSVGMGVMGLTDGMNQEMQQKHNRFLVIDLLRQEGICSRADLAKLTNLKRATITNIINEFMQRQLVIEDGILEGKKGRRSIGIRVNGQYFKVIGVMVTRKYYCMVMMGLSGEMDETVRYTIHPNTDASALMDEIIINIRLLISKYSHCRVLAVGIALPGPYKKEQDELVFVTNLVGLEGIPILKKLQQSFDIPVFVENDANAAAYAQLWYHVKKSEFENLVYIVAGQGIGSGIVSGGQILSGEIGIAGEFGHTTINFDGPRCECGNRGCVEKYCSILALEENIRTQIKHGKPTILPYHFTYEDLLQAMQRQDELAVTEYTRVCEYLAIGIVNIINQINPKMVIIGDQLAELSPKLMLDIIHRTVAQSVRPLIRDSLTIETNKLAYNPIMLGAGAIAAQNVFENPFLYLG